MNPYEVLGVDVDTDDAAVRKAYLERIRRYSPEKDPDRFKAVTQAYEMLKNEKNRLWHFLFDKVAYVEKPIDALLHHFTMQDRRKPLNKEGMREFLTRCAKRP